MEKRYSNGYNEQIIINKWNNLPINTTCHFEERSDEKSVYTFVDAYRSFTTFRMT